jgi:DNA-binding response OmpR family regulator
MHSILIIEDDLSLLELYKTKFEHENFMVSTAVNGEEGFEKIKKTKPDIVILDLFMPRLSGFDVMKLARADRELKDIPIIVLTNVSVDVEDLLKNWGATECLLKANVTPDDILARVNHFIQHQNSDRKIESLRKRESEI